MRVVLLALLLLFSVRGDSAQTQKGLRLCGREFFRAVVYTCGGSRWRRGHNEDKIKGMFGTKQFVSPIHFHSILFPTMEVNGAYGWFGYKHPQNIFLRFHQSKYIYTGYEIQTGVESFTANEEMDRTERDLYSMLPILCCKVGCQKSDLALLC